MICAPITLAQTNTKVSMNATSIFSLTYRLLWIGLLTHGFIGYAAPGGQAYRMAKKTKTVDEKEDKFTKVISKQKREKEKLKLARYDQLSKEAAEKPQSILRKRRLAAHRDKSGRKTYSNMAKEELFALRDKKLIEKQTYKNKNRMANCNDSLIIYTERLIKLSDDINVIAQLMLDLAELYYEQKQWDKAAAVFKEFSHLYPGNEKTEYALYKGISCMYQTVKNIDPERDQTKVKETIELAQKFLDRKIFTQFKEDVSHIQTACYEQLVDYELIIVDFYLKNNNLAVTQKRLEYVRTELLAKTQKQVPNILQYEIILAERKRDEETVQAKKMELAQLLNVTLENLPPLKRPTYFFAWKF